MALIDGLRTLRQPEYTGENRCLPCTAVNAAIAVVAAAALAVVVPLEPAGAAAVGGAVLLLAGAAIYLRGYLVPGTPTLTRTYLPDSVLRRFEHAPAGPTGSGDVDPAAVLEAAGAITECATVDDLCLTDGFRGAWRARIDAFQDTDASRGELGAMLDLPPDALTLEEFGSAFVAMAGRDGTDRVRVGQWESPGAFLADMAAARVLDEWYPDWSGLAPDQRGRVLNGLRVFLETCPTCGGPVTLGEETVESCCRSREVVVVACEDCGDRLLEADQPPAS